MVNTITFSAFPVHYFKDSHICVSDEVLRETKISNEDTVMSSIRDDLRTSMPLSATLPSENITFPTVGEVSFTMET